MIPIKIDVDIGDEGAKQAVESFMKALADVINAIHLYTLLQTIFLGMFSLMVVIFVYMQYRYHLKYIIGKFRSKLWRKDTS